MSTQSTSASVRTLTPSGILQDASGHQTTLRAPMVRRVMEGWAIRREIEALEERLKDLQSKLKGDFQSEGGSISLIVPGVCRWAFGANWRRLCCFAFLTPSNPARWPGPTASSKALAGAVAGAFCSTTLSPRSARCW